MNIDDAEILMPDYVGWTNVSVSTDFNGRQFATVVSHAAICGDTGISMQEAFDECCRAVARFADEVSPFGRVVSFELRVAFVEQNEIGKYRSSPHKMLRYDESMSSQF